MAQDNAGDAMEITTNTIAELYIKQGYLDKALDIYKAILEIEPGNEVAGAKLKEIEAMMAETGGEGSEAPGPPQSVPTGTVTIEAQVARLESWLVTVQEMRGSR